MPAAQTAGADAGESGGWRARFASWWDGAGRSQESQRLTKRLLRPQLPAAAISEADRERIMRIEAPQLVWGAGHSGPGNPAFYEKLLSSAAVEPGHDMVLVGAGLGGAARDLRRRFDISVTGLEASEAVVEKAGELNAEADMADKVSVRAFNPEALKLKARSTDVVLVEPLLFSVQNKLELLRELDLSLRGAAQIVMLDFVLGGITDANKEDWNHWTEHERPQPKVRTMGEQKTLIRDARLKLRQANDITAIYNRMIVKAWARCLDQVEAKSKSDQANDPVLRGVAELAEFWARRAALMEMGALKVVRFQLGRAKFGGK